MSFRIIQKDISEWDEANASTGIHLYNPTAEKIETQVFNALLAHLKSITVYRRKLKLQNYWINQLNQKGETNETK